MNLFKIVLSTALLLAFLTAHLGNALPTTHDMTLVKRAGEDTLLHQAADMGNLITARKLIQLGADVNAPDQEGFTPMHLAIRHSHVQIVQLLLDREANVNAVADNGQTPLFFAAYYSRTDLVSLLLNNGADANIADREGLSPLHIVARQGRTEIAQMLIEYGANINAVDALGRTPIRIAQDNGRTEIMSLLGEMGAVEYTNEPKYLMPVHQAAANGDIRALEELIQNGESATLMDEAGMTPLEYAYENVHIQAIEFLESKVRESGAEMPSLSVDRLHKIAFDAFSECDQDKINRLIAIPEKYHLTLGRFNTEDDILSIAELVEEHSMFSCMGCISDRLSSTAVNLPCGHQLCKECKNAVSGMYKRCPLCRMDF